MVGEIMSRYCYPAVFTLEEQGVFSIVFPDLEGCYTCGDDLTDGIMMAEDVLAFTLYDYERENREIPASALPEDMPIEEGQFINYIACDTLVYRKRHNNKAVKKTLTIPEWLNESAMAMGLNFSQVLQEALIQKTQSY